MFSWCNAATVLGQGEFKSFGDYRFIRNTTRVDPTRDILLADNTPIDYLDFASPVRGWAARWGSTRPTNGPAKPAANGVAFEDEH